MNSKLKLLVFGLILLILAFFASTHLIFPKFVKEKLRASGFDITELGPLSVGLRGISIPTLFMESQMSELTVRWKIKEPRINYSLRNLFTDRTVEVTIPAIEVILRAESDKVEDEKHSRSLNEILNPLFSINLPNIPFRNIRIDDISILKESGHSPNLELQKIYDGQLLLAINPDSWAFDIALTTAKNERYDASLVLNKSSTHSFSLNGHIGTSPILELTIRNGDSTTHLPKLVLEGSSILNSEELSSLLNPIFELFALPALAINFDLGINFSGELNPDELTVDLKTADRPHTITSLKLTSGTIEAIGNLPLKPDKSTSNPPPAGTLGLNVLGLSGETPWFTFSELGAKAVLDLSHGISTESPVRVSLKSINPGVEFTDLSGILNYSSVSTQPIQFELDSAHIFGGTVKSKPFKFAATDFQSLTIPLAFTNFDLAKILAVYNQESIIGTGILDGSIPLTITQQGVTVKNGKISADPPGGILKYKGDELNQRDDSHLGVVINALSNFQYEVLNATADYDPTGELTLNVNIQGVNPDLNSDQPYNVNLSVEENIPALIKSLRLTGDVEEGIRQELGQ